MRQHVAIAGLWVADATAIAGLRSAAAKFAQAISAPRAWLAAAGPDHVFAAVAAAALWLVAVWLGLGLLTASAARLPGIFGRLAARVRDRMLPRALQRLLVGTAGIGVLLAPVSAAAHPSPSPTSATPAGSSAVVTLPPPHWPQDPLPAQLPAPRWPIGATPTTPTTPTRPTTPTQPRSTSLPPDVTVQRGDSLWLIACRRLGARCVPDRVAMSWPRWYAANRSVIGDDPNYITPGQVLHAPTARTQEVTT